MSHGCARKRLAIYAALLCGTIAASAQVREQITVEAVDVPVSVFSQGKPVRNLTKDDFELYVNGKRQPIDYFEAVDFTAPPPAAARPEGAPLPPQLLPPQPRPKAELRDRRLFLLLFDLVFKTQNLAGYALRLGHSRRAAVDMVDHALPSDFFAVAAVTGSGIKFTTPFLRDHDAIRRAILQLTPSTAHDALALSITSSERQMAESWGAGGGRVAGASGLSDVIAASSALEKDREVNLANDQIEGYGEVAARLRGLEGFKHVILFSDGIILSDGDPSDPTQTSSVKRMAAMFQSANAYLHTVDLTPMATGSDPAKSTPASAAPQQRPAENPELLGLLPNVNWFAPKRSIIPPSENELLFTMSDATGGTWIHWKNEIAPALQDLSTSYSAVYRLGFKPAGARKGHNDIDVKVKNLPRGATVSFRRGFSTTVPSKAAAPDPFVLADIVQNDTPQSGTPPEIVVDGRRLAVVVPVITLSKQFGAVEGVQVMLYVFDSKGVPVLSRVKTFSIPEQAAADRIIEQKLELAPGSYVAKVLLRAGDSLAFVKEPFEIAQ